MPQHFLQHICSSRVLDAIACSLPSGLHRVRKKAIKQHIFVSIVIRRQDYAEIPQKKSCRVEKQNEQQWWEPWRIMDNIKR
jgi:hypothetical protein